MIFFNMAAAAVCGAMAGMGIGSAGLFVLYLTAIAGTEQLAAQGINLIFFIAASAGALPLNLKKRKIDRRRTLLLAIFGGVGAVAGAFAGAALHPALLRKLFGWLLILSALPVFFGRPKKRR